MLGSFWVVFHLSGSVIPRGLGSFRVVILIPCDASCDTMPCSSVPCTSRPQEAFAPRWALCLK